MLLISGEKSLQMWLSEGFWDGEITLDYLVDPKYNHECHYKRESEGDETDTEEKAKKDLKMVTLKTEVCSHKPRNASGFQKLEEVWSLSLSFQNSVALLRPWFQHSETV